MEPKEETEYRQLVVDGAKTIFAKGLVDFGEGNVSIRVKKTDEFFITPSQNDYENMKLEDVVQMKCDGTQISKGKPSSSEYRLHAAIYMARPKAGCVIHNHSPYASMLAVAGKDLPVLFEEMTTFLGGPVKVAKYGQSGSEDLGKNALEAMGETNSCFLQSHGVLVCGRDLKGAIKAATLIEKMSQVYLGAMQLGKAESIDEKYLPKFKDYFKGLSATYSPPKKVDVKAESKPEVKPESKPETKPN